MRPHEIDAAVSVWREANIARGAPCGPEWNWTPEGKAERAALRREFTDLTPAQRTEQVFELSRFMSRVAESGHRQRSA